MKTPVLVALNLLMLASSAMALPDGTSAVPDEVKIPKVNGKTLPVSLYASIRNRFEIYVKPLEGMFVGEKNSVQSVTVDCDRLNTLMEQQRTILAAHTRDLQAAEREQINIINEEEKLKVAIARAAQFKAEVKTQTEIIAQLDTDLAAITTREDKIVGEITELNRKKVLAEAAGNTEEVKRLDDELRVKRSQLAAVSSESDPLLQKLREAKQKKNIAQANANRADAEVKASDEAVTESRARREKLLELMNAKQTRIDQNLLSESRASAGYLRMKAQFAPAEYLEALEKANPEQFTFRYVPNLGAAADITFPKPKADSILSNPRGSMLLATKFDNASETYGSSGFFAAIFGKVTKGDAPLEEIQRAAMQYSDDLEGLKSLTLELTPIGACALKRKQDFAGEFESGGVDNRSAETFALSLFYSYPVSYDIKVTGKYYQKRMLYELFKRSKSSSWFGFKKSEKESFVRRITEKDFVDIKVTSTSPLFDDKAAEEMRQKMSEMIAFEAVKEYLDLSKAVPASQTQNVNLNEERAPSAIGKKLMMIKNPWTFWAGVALKTLDSMFGSSSASRENDIQAEKEMKIDWNMRFALPHSGSITLGDFKEAAFNQ